MENTVHQQNIIKEDIIKGGNNKMKLNSAKLGELEYTEDDIITLSSPLLGFPELQDFLLISDDNSYPFLWFQSVEDKDICFILIETNIFFKDYKPDIPKRELKVLAISDKNDMKIFSIVVVPTDPKLSTANLRAPLVVNFDKKLAKQIILDNEEYRIKMPLFESE